MKPILTFLLFLFFAISTNAQSQPKPCDKKPSKGIVESTLLLLTEVVSETGDEFAPSNINEWIQKNMKTLDLFKGLTKEINERAKQISSGKIKAIPGIVPYDKEDENFNPNCSLEFEGSFELEMSLADLFEFWTQLHSLGSGFVTVNDQYYIDIITKYRDRVLKEGIDEPLIIRETFKGRIHRGRLVMLDENISLYMTNLNDIKAFDMRWIYHRTKQPRTFSAFQQLFYYANCNAESAAYGLKIALNPTEMNSERFPNVKSKFEMTAKPIKADAQTSPDKNTKEYEHRMSISPLLKWVLE